MKKLNILLLGAALMFASGCVTQGLIDNHAKAHREDDKEKKETVWVDGQSAYYFLLPFTVAADIATSPIQIPMMIAVLINGGPHF